MSKFEIKENLKKYARTEECPVRNVLSCFSGKWPVLILCVLSENGATRFNEIGKAIPDISSKVLSDTLKNLEADDMIERKLYAEIPPRVEYALSPKGRSIMPILTELIGWALENFDSFGPKKDRGEILSSHPYPHR